nr:porin [uncultured Roseateles sp.]
MNHNLKLLPLLTPLLAVALTATCGLAQAQNGVEIYGTLDLYVGQQRDQTGTAPARTTRLVGNGAMTTSFIGFRGREDLGGGLSAIFGLESYMRADSGATGRNDADPFWSRLAIVGLEGAWGRLTLGRHVTPYSLAATLNSPFVGSTGIGPVFANTISGGANLAGGSRFNNSVRYTTPSIGGFDADFIYGLGLERESSAADHKRDRVFETVGRYAAGPLRITAGAHFINLNAGNDGHDQQAYVLAGVYDFGVVKLHVQGHLINDDFNNPANNIKRKLGDIGITIPLGAGAILASHTHARVNDNSAATYARRNTSAVGYDHNLSKRTDVFVALQNDKTSTPNTLNTRLALVGMRHRF